MSGPRKTTAPAPKLPAPFPWFGGKARVAHEVWDRFGPSIRSYVEPFAGSLAVLLGRPQPSSGVETVNDLDRYICNFWRAVQAAPDEVARYADWPVNEVDLRARHDWLVSVGRETLARMDDDPDLYDAKVAGWWAWGISCWIGSGWCPEGRGPRGGGNAGKGVNRQMPRLGDFGAGVNGPTKLSLRDWIQALSGRLRGVRVTQGGFERVLTPSVLLARKGVVALRDIAVFLDPPYDSAEHAIKYGAETVGVAARAREWAIAHGDDYRIALCGYEGEHAMPESWEALAWKTKGGYGCQGGGRGADNGRRERIWFSPTCQRPRERSLW